MDDDDKIYKQLDAKRRKRLLRFLFFVTVLIALFQVIDIVNDKMKGEDLHSIYLLENRIPSSENRFFL